MQKERLRICQQESGWHHRDIADVSTHNSGREYLSSDHVACYRMAEGPPESVQVDEDNANDASSRSASHVTFTCGGSSETDVEGQVEHSSSLYRSADQQRKTSSDTAVQRQ
jgi:hypothetical protein